MMKLSKADFLFLSNFSSINESIHFHPGQEQSVVANSGNLFAFASFEEEFPKEFCLFDLNHFITNYNNVALTEGDTVLEFPEGQEQVIIKSNDTEHNIRFCDPKLVEELDRSKKYIIENPDIEFTLSESMLEFGRKVAASNGFEHLCFEGMGDEIYMVAETVSQNGSNISERTRRKLGQPNRTSKDFTAVFEVAKLKMLNDDYEVRIAKEGGAEFTSKNRDYRFFVALQQKVRFS